MGDLANAIDGVARNILDYALVLAAIGTITMALVELAKAVIRAHYYYHRVMVGAWTGNDTKVRDELLGLAAGGADNAGALYNQSSARMMGQIQAAANVALDFPTVFPAFYQFLTTGSASAGKETDAARWQAFAARMADGIPTDPATRAEFEAESRQSTPARARLGNMVTRRLDAFQTLLEYRWARLNQIVAVAGGAILLFSLLPAAGGVTTRVALALIGGLVAPFAKDVVNALTGLRASR